MNDDVQYGTNWLAFVIYKKHSSRSLPRCWWGTVSGPAIRKGKGCRTLKFDSHNNNTNAIYPITQYVYMNFYEHLQMVVGSLGENNIMVILDNHISKPGWCCSKFDGNGFFGDKYFDPEVWLSGLATLAAMFNGSANVVGMSLRNELRGAKQNVKDWYRYHEFD